MKNIKRNSGQSLVEFVLLFPIVFFLITGFLDLGRAVYYYSALTNAVRESTRYAIVHKTDLEAAFSNPANNPLQDKVLEFAYGLTQGSNPLLENDVVVSVTKEDELFVKVSITATYEFAPITPGINAIFTGGTGIPLVAHSTMMVTPGSR